MSRISLVELTKAAAIVANRASAIVRHIHRSGNLNIVDKAENASAANCTSSAVDPCTLADVLSQRLIAGSLRALYPAIRVCGEEDENENDVQQRAAIQAEPAVHAKFPHLALPVLAGGVHFPSWIPLFNSTAIASGDDDSVLETDITVWVDPLDGTKEFTEGVLDAVTILVGIAVRGRAAAGVINQPFAQRTIVGVRGRGSIDCRVDEATDQLVDARPIVLSRPASTSSAGSTDAGKRIVVTTRSHMSAALAAMVDAVRPSEVHRAGGCGGKCILLLDGRADAYVYPVKGTKKWDSCAPDAILRAAGGLLTDGLGAEISYDPAESPHNRHGIVCTAAPGGADSGGRAAAAAWHESFLPPRQMCVDAASAQKSSASAL